MESNLHAHTMVAATIEAPPPPPPPLPTTTKKPRRKARHVSSRYMMTPSPSPMPPASGPSSSPVHPSSCLFKHSRIPSVPSSPDATESEPDPNPRFADENQPLTLGRSLETPTFLATAAQSKIMGGGQRKRAAVRLFGEIAAGGGDHQPNSHQAVQEQPRPQLRRPRPGTPFAAVGTPKGAILGGAHLRSGRNPAAKGAKFEGFAHSRASPFRSDDASSENSSTMGDSESEACSVSNQGGFCDSPPIVGSRIRQQASEFRSSMPEADLLPSMSSRRALDGGSSRQNDGSTENSCCRSLNLALSSSQQNPFHQNKPPTGRCIPSRICLPPQPPSSKLGPELKKGKKGSSRQEDVHMLRLHHNRYLQWRFINAKAKDAVDARTAAAEKSLYGLSGKISEMQGSVVGKRIELERLKSLGSLSTILELQMPHLDNWSALEEDYSSSITGVTKALQDASLRLPISGNVRADVNDVKDVFDYTTNIFDSLSSNVQKFIPKAEAIEDVISDLAELASTERALIEECGNLLSEAHKLQVTECSLRSQLIQAKRTSGM